MIDSLGSILASVYVEEVEEVVEVEEVKDPYLTSSVQLTVSL